MDIKNMKPCKLCPNKRYAAFSLCYKHHFEKIRRRKEEKKSRHQQTKTFELGEKKKWHKKAWGAFSEYVRRRGADSRGMVACYTCYKKSPWQEMHAGHRYHNRLDFDLRNIHPQDPACNTYRHGELGEYERHLIEDNGLEFAQQLKKDAFQHHGYSLQELKNIYEEYSNLLKSL